MLIKYTKILCTVIINLKSHDNLVLTWTILSLVSINSLTSLDERYTFKLALILWIPINYLSVEEYFAYSTPNFEQDSRGDLYEGFLGRQDRVECTFSIHTRKSGTDHGVKKD